MYRNPDNRRATRYAICTAMAAALVSGCAGSGNLAMADSVKPASAKVDRATEKQVDRAERQVAKSPQDVSARVELANAYLRAGRFESAITTFEDARYLGDEGAGTALSLALSHVGAGQNRAAVEVLDQNRDSIPASDLGLALALAGETGRGVAILSDALRSGEDTPKLRQNLAYAYALDGRWREARLMAAQDIPADKLDARISDWAMQGRAEDYRTRVAGLLGVPDRADSGQPEALALGRTSGERFAAAPTDKTYNLVASENAELPPVESGESFWTADGAASEASAPAPQPLVPETPAVAEAAPGTARFEEAFAPEGAPSKPGFVSKPVVQPIPAKVSAVSSQKPAYGMTDQRVSVEGTHLVQLGSFSSQTNAERAWKIFVSRNPELRNFDKTITQAVVRGKTYWRVSAAGFDKRAARSMCSSVKGRGGGCIAYSANHPLPGAIAGTETGGAMRARR